MMGVSLFMHAACCLLRIRILGHHQIPSRVQMGVPVTNGGPEALALALRPEPENLDPQPQRDAGR